MVAGASTLWEHICAECAAPRRGCSPGVFSIVFLGCVQHGKILPVLDRRWMAKDQVRIAPALQPRLYSCHIAPNANPISPCGSGQAGRQDCAAPSPWMMRVCWDGRGGFRVMTLRLYWTCHTSSQRRNTGRATGVPASLPRPFRSSLSRGGTVDVLVDAHNSTTSSQPPQPPPRGADPRDGVPVLRSSLAFMSGSGWRDVPHTGCFAQSALHNTMQPPKTTELFGPDSTPSSEIGVGGG